MACEEWWIGCLALLCLLLSYLLYSSRQRQQRVWESQCMAEVKRLQEMRQEATHRLRNDLQVLLGYYQLNKKEAFADHFRQMMVQAAGEQRPLVFAYAPLTRLLLDLRHHAAGLHLQLVADPGLQTLSVAQGRTIWRVLRRLCRWVEASAPAWWILRLERSAAGVSVRLVVQRKERGGGLTHFLPCFYRFLSFVGGWLECKISVKVCHPRTAGQRGECWHMNWKW